MLRVPLHSAGVRYETSPAVNRDYQRFRGFVTPMQPKLVPSRHHSAVERVLVVAELRTSIVRQE